MKGKALLDPLCAIYKQCRRCCWLPTRAATAKFHSKGSIPVKGMIKISGAAGLAAVVSIFVLLISVKLWAEVLPPGTYVLDQPGPTGGDYLYRTEKIVAEPQHKKNLWEYLSFFAWKSDKDDVHLFRAEEATELKMRVRELSRQLIVNAQEAIAEEYVLTVNTFVNLHNLYKTSSLGRYIGEQLIGELQLAGVEVIDIRKSAGLMIHEKHGEYGLSREMKELSYIHTSQAMVVGTYTYTEDQILLNARLLRNVDGMVLSNASLAFELDTVTRQLLADEAMPARKGGLVSVQAFQ